MSLPPVPPRRRAPRLPPPPPRRGTAGKLRQIVRRHEEEERPFDPRQPPTWRGSSRDLVANRRRLTMNPSGFREDLHELVSRYHRVLNTEKTVDELTDEIARAFDEEDTDDAMRTADELLEGHGVEALGPVDMHDGPPYTYINFGDTYDPTIMWSRDNNKVFVAMGGWGEVWSEEGEPNMLQEGWDSWLGSEFESAVRSELESKIETLGSGSKESRDAERTLEIFESWDSDQQKQLFEKALWEAQQAGGGGGRKYPEVSQESDGIFVHHLDVVVAKAAELVFNGWTPTEQTPNARRRKVGPDTYVPHEPRPRFRVGDRVTRTDTNDAGEVAVVGAYDQELGFRRYKVQEDSGARIWWNDTHMKNSGADSGHTKNARRRVTYRLRGTADDHRDRGMLLGRSHRTLSADYRTEVEALDAAERFMKDVSPLGRAAKVWVEETQPDGGFRVVAKWTGQYGAAGGLIWKPS